MISAATQQAAQGDPSAAGFAALAGIVYVVALLLGAAPGPLSLVRLAREYVRTREGTTPRPEAMSPQSDATPAEDVRPDTTSRLMSPSPSPEVSPEIEVYGDGVLMVSREHVVQWGPRPELAHLAGSDDPPEPAPPATPEPGEPATADPEDQMPRLRRGAGSEDRHQWIRWQQRRGKRPAWIDREGARLAGCTEKTIQRDRKHLAAAQEARQHGQ